MTTALTLAVASVVAMSLGAPAALADQSQFTDFEGFDVGVGNVGASVEGQNGWSADNPSLDQEVVDVGGNTVLRVSNFFTSGSFGDKIFAPRLGGIPSDTINNPTNSSPGAFAGESSTETTLNVFKGKFSFRSATGAMQPGLAMSISADNGTGGRQSYIGLEDTASGINVFTFDIDSTTGNFIGPISIASGLSYHKWHTAGVEIQFKDGPANDVVKYFINGKRVHKGPSWEQFYRLDPNNENQEVNNPLGVPVQTLILPVRGNPCSPSCEGGGYLFDKVKIAVSKSNKDQDDKFDSDGGKK